MDTESGNRFLPDCTDPGVYLAQEPEGLGMVISHLYRLRTMEQYLHVLSRPQQQFNVYVSGTSTPGMSIVFRCRHVRVSIQGVVYEIPALDYYSGYCYRGI